MGAGHVSAAAHGRVSQTGSPVASTRAGHGRRMYAEDTEPPLSPHGAHMLRHLEATAADPVLADYLIRPGQR